MTRLNKKQIERRTLDYLLAALQLQPEQPPNDGEAPDFIVQLRGKRVGVEITTYQSGTTLPGGARLRKVESGWEELKRTLDTFRETQAHLRDISVGLMFKGPVPPRLAHKRFSEVVAAFLTEHLHQIGTDAKSFQGASFSSGLMTQYLQRVFVQRQKYAEWYSNLSTGWLPRVNAILPSIIAEKAGKIYRPTDELWLAIQCGARISEVLLPLEGLADFTSSPELRSVSWASPFSRVVLIGNAATYMWTRAGGWQELRRFP